MYPVARGRLPSADDEQLVHRVVPAGGDGGPDLVEDAAVAGDRSVRLGIEQSARSEEALLVENRSVVDPVHEAVEAGAWVIASSTDKRIRRSPDEFFHRSHVGDGCRVPTCHAYSTWPEAKRGCSGWRRIVAGRCAKRMGHRSAFKASTAARLGC
jgi:hypothetical protein